MPQRAKEKYLEVNIRKTSSLQHQILVDKSSGQKVKTILYPCGKCSKECIDVESCSNPKFEDFSVQCDKCNIWYHYVCLNLTGQEPELQEGSDLSFVYIRRKDPTLETSAVHSI